MLSQGYFQCTLVILKGLILHFIANINFDTLPWILTQDNAWGDHEPSPNVFITLQHDFLKTPHAHKNVPDWFDKLQVVQNQEQSQEHIESDNEHFPNYFVFSKIAHFWIN